ncbi:MAG: hypothetical protein LBR56_09095, partial [Sporomusaceae bacterium]|nr:hypothetical protein [Sporomusaceae bacterium]
MRFCIELILENNVIEKDKNRLFISLLKKAFFDFDKSFFQDIYESNKTLRKDFTFAAYLGKCKFNRDNITLENKKILLNISTYNKIEGIMIYNSFLKLKKDQTHCAFGRENRLTVVAIRNLKDQSVRSNA